MTDDDDGAGIRELRVPSGPLRVMVERQDVCDRFIDIFGLVKEGLTMKGSHILVEIDHEKVQAPGSTTETLLIMAHNLEVMSRRFGG
jgi:hypothetical protein